MQGEAERALRDPQALTIPDRRSLLEEEGCARFATGWRSTERPHVAEYV